jgi:nicotinamidase-related amidase
MKNTALILIDFQNDYFEDFTDARYILNNTIEASMNAAKLLEVFREMY